MKRFSVYVLYGVAIFILVSAYDFWHTRQYWTEYYDKNFGINVERLNDEVIAARMIYQGFGGDHLRNYLESRRRVKNINFWVLYDGDAIAETSASEQELKNLIFDRERALAEILYDPDYKYYYYTAEDLGNGRQLVVGLFYDSVNFVNTEIKVAISELGRYLAGLLMVCLATFVFFMRDIVNAIRTISSRGEKSYKSLRANSKEAEMLAKGMAAYDDQAKQLEKERDIMTEQVLSSLRTEIMSGRKTPYSFDCTLIRTDINNFSTIYNNHSVEEFSSTINEFFTDVTHIVARYGGYVHEFIGDEVIFYFKDDEVKNSFAVALSAVRDINATADIYHRMTLKERGYPFTVKSSLAHGTLRFGRFVDGFGLSGPSLIETVRILSTVAEKDGCVAVFDERHATSLEGIADYESYAEVKLKGFSEARRLLVYRGHQSVHHWLHSRRDADVDKLTYYRGDEDLKTLLEWMRAHWRDSSERVLSVVYRLRGFTVTKSDGKAQEILLAWLNDMLNESLEHKRAGDMKVLASAVRLMENLIPRNECVSEIETILNRSMEVVDRRVVANALDTLSVVKEAESERARALIEHPDNRIAANALVREGMKDISSYVLKHLKYMLKSDEYVRVSSGLYALGEIAEFHRTRDSIYYATQLGFQRLIRSLPDFAFHQDERIRRQAVAAAKKSGSPEILTAIEERARLAIHADYASEVLQLLSPEGVSSNKVA